MYFENKANDHLDCLIGTQDSYMNEMLLQHLWDITHTSVLLEIYNLNPNIMQRFEIESHYCTNDKLYKLEQKLIADFTANIEGITEEYEEVKSLQNQKKETKMENKSYEEGKKAFEETGLEWMKRIAESFDDTTPENIEKVYNAEMGKNNSRDKIIDDLLSDKDIKMELLQDEFPNRMFRIQYDNKEMYLKHDSFPDIKISVDTNMKVYKDIPFDTKDATQNIKDYISKYGINKTHEISDSKENDETELERE